MKTKPKPGQKTKWEPNWGDWTDMGLLIASAWGIGGMLVHIACNSLIDGDHFGVASYISLILWVGPFVIAAIYGVYKLVEWIYYNPPIRRVVHEPDLREEYQDHDSNSDD